MTSEQELWTTLRDIGFLDGIPDDHLEKLAQIARIVEFPPKKVIFREGEPASFVYIILGGNVSLEICAPGVGCRRILTAGEGELLGWSPVLEQTRLTSTARTISPVKAVEIKGSQIVAMCEHDPRFGYIFMRRTAMAIAKRLVATRMQLLDVFGEQMPSAEKPDD